MLFSLLGYPLFPLLLKLNYWEAGLGTDCFDL